MVLQKRIFKFRHCIFAILSLSTLGKGRGPSFEQTWIPFTQLGCIVTRLVVIGPVVLEKIFKFCIVDVLSLFRNYLPLEKDRALHLNKLESLSPKDAFCQVWSKLAQWFCRKRFFISSIYFSLFHNFFPFEKGGVLDLNKLNPLHPGMLCAKFGWNCLEKKIFKIHQCIFTIS